MEGVESCRVHDSGGRAQEHGSAGTLRAGRAVVSQVATGCGKHGRMR
jgi:hypothetical protein